MGNTKRYRTANYKLLEEIVENKEKRISQSTLKGVRAVMELFKNFLASQFGEDFLTHPITPEVCSQFSDHLDSIVKPSSKRTYQQRLIALFSEAVDLGMIEVSPMRRGARPRLPQRSGDIVYLTKTEMQKLFKVPCFHQDTKNAFILACYTGLSLGDIESLEWNHIVFDNGQMMIVKNSVKQGKELRVPVVRSAKDMLLKIKSEYDALPEKRRDGRVFHLFSRTIVGKDLAKWQSDADLSKDLTFNVARHTFGTLAVSAGVSLYTLVKWMGLGSFDSAMEYVNILKNTHQDSDISALEFVLS